MLSQALYINIAIWYSLLPSAAAEVFERSKERVSDQMDPSFSLDYLLPINYKGRFLKSRQSYVFLSFEQNRVTDQEASRNNIQVYTIKLESTKHKKSLAQAQERLTPKLKGQ